MSSAPNPPSPPSRYGAVQPASSAATQIFSRATTTTQAFFATRRPWPEFSSYPSFTRPYSVGEATIRIRKNLNYFRVNYTMIVLFILFVSLLWHPTSLIVFLVVFVGWFFLFFFRDQPLVVLNRQVDDRIVLGVLGLVTILSLVFTRVGINVLVSLLIGTLFVGVHAAFRSIDDLYGELDGDDGGMSSVVGDPSNRTGYSSF